MSSERATKRRKLDAYDSASPSVEDTLRTATAPTSYSNVPITQSQQPASPTEHSAPSTNLGRTLSVQETWQEAKAKSTVRRPNVKPAPDVYEDIEGAHGRPVPAVKKPASRRKKPLSDPLRNQRTNGGNDDAQLTPRKGTATLGFFKQFHSPKKATQLVPEGVAHGDVNGASNHAKLCEEVDVQTDSEDEDGEDGKDREDVEQREDYGRSHRDTGGDDIGRRQAADMAIPKKTFEDEIKELEEAARTDAAQEQGSATASTPSLRRRPAARRAVPGKEQLQQSAKAKPSQSSYRKSKSAAERIVRRTDLADEIVGSEERESEQTQTDGPVEERRSARSLGPSSPKSTTEIVTLDPEVKTHVMSPQAHGIIHRTFGSEQLTLIQNILLEKLTGKRPVSLANLEDEYARVSQIVSQTVTAGESNSMLLIGARGSGKTALVDRILREQAINHAGDFHVIRLNGFIHTDDKIALREIWRQLGREMELEEGDGSSRNYADTLTSLLALLSHPAEQDHSDLVTKSVIFILDEFELFASHPRQTLLYNLFDIAQSRKAPIAVFGLTTRIDVAECLEKRVKSRFSHRYVHLSLAKSFAAFQQVCSASLAVHTSELSMAERAHLDVPDDAVADTHGGSPGGAAKAWNVVMENALATETYQHLLRRIYSTTKSSREFTSELLLPLATLPTDAELDPSAIAEHLTGNTAISLRGPDSKLDGLASLSALQLALLICAARLTAIHNAEVITFPLAYEEYKTLASKARLQASASGVLAQGAGARLSSKDVAKGAWEDLMEYGLVLDDGRAGGRVDVGLEEIGMSGVELGQWGRWCREI